MSTQKFWERLQEIIPPGEEITWQRLWREFGRQGSGVHINFLREKGFVYTRFTGYIRINEDKRGEEFV